MPTKFRRDLTPEDFRIAKRFKHHLIRLIISKTIPLLACPESGQIQTWRRNGAEWQHSSWQKVEGPFIAISIQNFRRIVRAIENDIPTITEGLIIATLKKFSMMIHTDENQWKWRNADGQTYIVLESDRLSQEGTLGNRKHNTASAKLFEYKQQIQNTMDQMGWDFEKALQFHSQDGLTIELLEDLLHETQEAETRKECIRQEIDKRIMGRKRPTPL